MATTRAVGSRSSSPSVLAVGIRGVTLPRQACGSNGGAANGALVAAKDICVQRAALHPAARRDDGVTPGRPPACARYNRRMDRTFLLVGALAGFVGVAFGAFGAHALRSR